MFQTAITDGIGKIVTTISNSNAAGTVISWTVGAVLSLSNKDDKSITSLANENSYTVRTACTSDIHFVYVYDSGSKKWIHCLSTNYIRTYENHLFSYRYYNCSTGNNEVSYDNINVKNQMSNRYSSRYNDAITVYRSYSDKTLIQPADTNIRQLSYKEKSKIKK
mgnify:FL=1